MIKRLKLNDKQGTYISTKIPFPKWEMILIRKVLLLAYNLDEHVVCWHSPLYIKTLTQIPFYL